LAELFSDEEFSASWDAVDDDFVDMDEVAAMIENQEGL
jgi:hypothetical protein